MLQTYEKHAFVCTCTLLLSVFYSLGPPLATEDMNITGLGGEPQLSLQQLLALEVHGSKSEVPAKKVAVTHMNKYLMYKYSTACPVLCIHVHILQKQLWCCCFKMYPFKSLCPTGSRSKTRGTPAIRGGHPTNKNNQRPIVLLPVITAVIGK